MSRAVVSRRLELGVATLLAVAGLVVSSQSSAHRRNIFGPMSENGAAFVSTDPQSIYSNDPHDPWNRIFQILFTRMLKVRMSTDFPEAAPFGTYHGRGLPGARNLGFSARTFERLEIGDRAIEPLYPSFLTNAGALQVLTEPGYSSLQHGLTDALSDKDQRPPLARALMQSDLWAAYDILYSAYLNPQTDGGESDERKQTLLSLLGLMIRKIALTPAEIKALPNNASALPNSHHAPNFFAPNSGWIEVEYMPRRHHDAAVHFRRVARVFIKPLSKPADRLQFLQSIREDELNQSLTTKVRNIEAVALAMQNLLIDTDGRIVPSPLIQDVQVRRFTHDDKGGAIKTDLREYELSRKTLLTNPSSDGFSELDDNSAVFAPSSGNDYTFASPFPLFDRSDSSFIVKMRHRCADCHGTDQSFLITLAVPFLTGNEKPPENYQSLDPLASQRAALVIEEKAKREDFKSLQRILEGK
jgi:hypothetical protein